MNAPPSPGRCSTHGLACGPDGQCALCHRDAAAPAARSTHRAVIGGLAALAILLVGAVGWRGARELAGAVQERVAAARAAEVAEAPANRIRLYTTSWCPHCAHARQWLKAQHVEYAELDVEKNAWARRENLRLNPRGSIPTLDADGEVVKGFSAEEFQAALARGAAHGAE